MTLCKLTAEEKAWLATKPPLAEINRRLPDVAALLAPVTAGHAMLIVEKLDELATLLRTQEKGWADVKRLVGLLERLVANRW